jgi:hypothetical protein
MKICVRDDENLKKRNLGKKVKKDEYGRNIMYRCM